MASQWKLLLAAALANAVMAQRHAFTENKSTSTSSSTTRSSSTTLSSTSLPSSTPSSTPSTLSSSSVASAASAISPSSTPPSTIQVGNMQSAEWLIISLVAILVLVFLYVTSARIARNVRLLVCMNNEKQNYFRTPSWLVAALRTHLIDAPLFHTRHRRELHLFRGPGIGILPTRLQTLVIATIVAINIALSVSGIEWYAPHSVNTLKHFRNRTGTLATANMVPLFIMAGRNNPFIRILGVNYDTFNLYHRWFGRICLAEVVCHLGAYLAADYYLEGWAVLLADIPQSSSAITGFIAFAAFLTMNIQGMACIRHAFYEFFLHFHIALAVTAIVALWYHLDTSPGQRALLTAAIVAWVAERLIRLTWIAYRNFGKRATRATVEALPGNAMRVTFKLARPWRFHHGQFLFVTIPAIGLWTSHPFSIAWAGEEPTLTGEKGLVMTRQDVLAQSNESHFSVIVRGREGFTQRLFQEAATAEDGTLRLSALVEGPYGTRRSMASYGTVVLFAGGVGISHHMPYLRSLVSGYASGVVAVRRVSLIWVVQSPEHLDWIRPWLTEVLALDRRREMLCIQIFVTRPRSAKEVQSPSETIQMFPGRPNIDTLLDKEIATRIGAMGVAVCGTGGLADDVRAAVRQRHFDANIELLEESFSW